MGSLKLSSDLFSPTEKIALNFKNVDFQSSFFRNMPNFIAKNLNARRSDVNEKLLQWDVTKGNIIDFTGVWDCTVGLDKYTKATIGVVMVGNYNKETGKAPFLLVQIKGSMSTELKFVSSFDKFLKTQYFKRIYAKSKLPNLRKTAIMYAYRLAHAVKTQFGGVNNVLEKE